MKRCVLALGLFATSPSLAADLVEPIYEPIAASTYDWSGLYLGGQLGAAVGGDRDGLELDLNGDGDFNDLDTLGIVDAEGGDNEAGFIGGVHVGYDKQFGSVVLGAEADISFINADFGSELVFNEEVILRIDQNVDYVGTVRVRAGYAFDRALLYGTGGLAVAGVENDFASVIDLAEAPGVGVSQTDDDTLFGYAIGGGLDYAVTDQISIGGQYLYTSFDDAEAAVTYSLAGEPDLSARSDDTIDFHRIEAKVSYRFN